MLRTTVLSCAWTFTAFRGTLSDCYLIPSSHLSSTSNTPERKKNLKLYFLYMLYFNMSCEYCCSCLVCIVVILCVFVVLCVYCCFYFIYRTAGYKSVFGRSYDRPPRRRFFLVSLCLQANAEMVPTIPSCHYMLLM